LNAAEAAQAATACMSEVFGGPTLHGGTFCRYIKELMSQAGLEIREDAMGNIFGRLEGTEAGEGAST